jgi:hypothetical protein
MVASRRTCAAFAPRTQTAERNNGRCSPAASRGLKMPSREVPARCADAAKQCPKCQSTRFGTLRFETSPSAGPLRVAFIVSRKAASGKARLLHLHLLGKPSRNNCLGELHGCLGHRVWRRSGRSHALLERRGRLMARARSTRGMALPMQCTRAHLGKADGRALPERDGRSLCCRSRTDL